MASEQNRTDLDAIGIDVGGTKTEVYFQTDDGFMSRTFPGGNVREQSTSHVAKLITTALQSCAEIDLSNAPRICVGAAGAGTADVQEDLFRELVRATQLAPRHLMVTSDARVAHKAAFVGGDAGVLIIAGTGSGCYAFEEERLIRAGGWGPALGDPGSGRSLGWAACRHLLSHIEAGTRDGLAVTMEWHLLGSKDNADISDILDLVYQKGYAISDLAPVLLHAMETSRVARQIVAEECRQLAEQALRIAGKLALQPHVFALTGGLTRHSGYLDVLTQALAARAPDAVITVSTRSPAEGAFEFAKEL